MAQPNTKKKKKANGQMFGTTWPPPTPFAPYHSIPKYLFSLFVLPHILCSFPFIFSQHNSHTHTHTHTHSFHLLFHRYTSHHHILHFFGQGSPKNFIGKAKAHSSLLFEVKIYNLFMGIMLLLEVIFI